MSVELFYSFENIVGRVRVAELIMCQRARVCPQIGVRLRLDAGKNESQQKVTTEKMFMFNNI